MIENQIQIEVDTKNLDAALEKANRLLILLKEVQQLICSLSKPND